MLSDGAPCTVQQHGSISAPSRYSTSQEPVSTMKRENIDSVLRSLRRVNLQGSFLGQTVAIRFGLSESDIETLEQLIDMGATTAGRLSELTGLTSGAVTRVIDRLEQAGYVRRIPDPADRRRVIVEVVPEKVAAPQVRLRDGRVLVQYRGLPFDWRRRMASFRLNTTIPWTIEIVGGIQRVEADLRSVGVRSFDLAGGAERIQLELGKPSGETRVRLVGGIKTARIERPTGIPVRLQVQGGIAEVRLDGTRLGRKGGETTLASTGWTGRGDRLDVTVVGGSKSIDIVSHA